MAAASLGYVPPTLGALLQEAIDVGVILNALRAATASPDSLPPIDAAPSRISRCVSGTGA
jgi:hypothetical protein